VKIFLGQGLLLDIKINNMKTQITIIGFGTMGKAIGKALAKHRTFRVIGIDKINSNSKLTEKNIKQSDFIILAIKPQDAKVAIEKYKIFFNKKSILISIMAGVSIKNLATLSGHKKIIRMMPNLGLSVNEGIAVWRASGLSKEEVKNAKKLIDKISVNFEVKNEDTINKITAISGSGPAYFFLLANCMQEACTKLGLNKNQSKLLVQKTFSASALLGKEGAYSELINKIASKKGTTEAALEIFKKNRIEEIVFQAVAAAYHRAKELNNEQ